ncbi:trimethylamine methyltransferase family protein [Curvivirga aplysinae]|uniref:trimethylamine methyltransferase family protein n=1 Tax=Curvivirga aplysinae TaxID=2529852 RepID=UPI0012BD365A|nr:trimethylamine methyltransferase family protein [Curvivirga aplysinae]MTI08862.1 methyltransferase [Curvivirga aplysinae]
MTAEVIKSRRGGRKARVAVREAPLAEDIRPIKPGLEGGNYKPLSQSDMDKINEAALKALETIGMSNAIPSCRELFLNAGATETSEGRILIPRSMVEDTLSKCARKFPLHAQDPKFDLEPWGSKVHFGTAGAAVHMVDHETRDYRESTLKDLYNMARIVDQMDNIHFFQRTVVPRDLPDALEMDVNTTYASVMGTKKHVGASWVLPEHLEASLKMLHEIAGGEDKWRERPFVSMSCCFVVPPMKFAEDACATMEVGVRAGMPILLLSAGQAGATSPAALAGSLVQAVAEVLAGLVYVNLIKPGAPAIFGTWPFVSDLRTGAMSGGSGEQALLTAGCAQMAQYYDLTGGAPGGITDSKLVDAQAGYEKGYNHTLAANSGLNMVYESAGMHASLLGASLEGLVVDNDSIGAALRTVRGIKVDEDSLSLEAIRDVCIGGPGHYLGHDQTIQRMQSDYAYPDVGDRTSPKEWAEVGSTSIDERAHKKVREILSSHYPDHVSDEIDQKIRSELPIKLDRDYMKPQA